MKLRILSYTRHIDQLLTAPPYGTNWQSVLSSHLTRVSFFQHERIVHLIVTMTVAILLIVTVGIALIAECIPMLLVSALLLGLLIPYISHYYLLENQVQHMYDQYDKILEHCS